MTTFTIQGPNGHITYLAARSQRDALIVAVNAARSTQGIRPSLPPSTRVTHDSDGRGTATLEGPGGLYRAFRA